MVEIHEWKEVASDFRDTLLLGNGASMAINGCFSYRSLLKEAEDRHLITPRLRSIFDHLRTEDFELVMRMLRTSYHINQALGVQDSETTRAYEEVRAALVQAVRAIHPSYEQIEGALPQMVRYMRRFKTVLSLNYDLTVYWAMLEGNRQIGGNWFKDCFVGGGFDEDWKRFRKPYDVSGATLVFYPHGNLALASTLQGADSKVMVQNQWGNLLDRILREWENGQRLPLFVSEGATEQKHLAIQRNGYLSTVYNSVMPSLGKTFVVYGCALKANDDHILKRICKHSTTQIAYGVYRGNRRPRTVERECEDFAERVEQINRKIAVCFFDSASSKCWVNT